MAELVRNHACKVARTFDAVASRKPKLATDLRQHAGLFGLCGLVNLKAGRQCGRLNLWRSVKNETGRKVRHQIGTHCPLTSPILSPVCGLVAVCVGWPEACGAFGAAGAPCMP